MSDLAIALPVKKIEAFCKRWHIIRFEVFGSITGQDFKPDSDIDVLVEYDSTYQRTYDDYLMMCDELEEILDHPVDLLHRPVIEQSTNPYRRDAILNSARIIYAA